MTTSHATTTDSSASDAPAFHERLSPPIGLRLAMLLLLPALIVVGLPLAGELGTAPVVIAAVAITAGALWAVEASAPTVEVRNRVLTAGRARIPLEMLGEAVTFTGEEAFIARGRGLDPAAYMLLRPGIDPVLRIDVLDPDDPTPYWLVSTRRPAQLARAIAGSSWRSVDR